MTHHFHSDGTISLASSPDPAIHRVKGREAFWLSADLGQANDYTAFVIVRDRQLPVWLTSVRQALGPRERVVVAADRFRGVNYPDVVSHLITVMNKPAIAGRCVLSIDGTAIGRVVSDILFERGVKHQAIQMTAGQDWSRKGRYINVSKTLLVETLSVLFSSRDLTFAHGLPLRKEIEEDLATFSLTTTAAGNQVITQSRTGAGHGDLGIALAISAFASQHLRPGLLGESKIDNYY